MPLHLKVHLGRGGTGDPGAALAQPRGQILRRAARGTQIPDGTARLGQAGADQRARLIEMLDRRLAGAGQQARDQLQLHRDADKTLGQRVVNLPRQAPPLRQHGAPLRLHLAHAPAIGQVTQKQRGQSKRE